MSKLESAKKIIKQGTCKEVCCPDCFLNERCPCKINAILQLAKEYIKENEMKFKVGDVVRWNGNTQDSNNLCMNFGMHDFLKGKKTHVISNITSSGNLKFKDDEVPYCFAPSWFEKVEEPIYEIGKKYIISDREENLEDEDYCNNEDNQSILAAYLPNAYYSFICVEKSYENEYKNGEIYNICTWKYAKPILEKKYKQYEKAKHEWIDKKVVDNFGTVSTIKMVGKDCVNFKQNDKEETCYDLFKRYTWEDGSVCGEEI